MPLAKHLPWGQDDAVVLGKEVVVSHSSRARRKHFGPQNGGGGDIVHTVYCTYACYRRANGPIYPARQGFASDVAALRSRSMPQEELLMVVSRPGGVLHKDLLWRRCLCCCMGRQGHAHGIIKRMLHYLRYTNSIHYRTLLYNIANYSWCVTCTF